MNKPSRLMAKRVAASCQKTKIPFSYSHPLQHKLSHPQAISVAFSEFYCKLYNLKDDVALGIPSDTAIDLFLDSINLPSILDAHLESLNAPFSEQEIASVIQSLPNGNSQGPDGFSNEYLKLYSSVLTPYLCSAFNYVMNLGTIPPENLQATVVALPKPGKSPDTPAHFRPISLLNADIKLCSKTLACSLLAVLPTLNNIDQVGLVKGREAPDGTRRLINIISHTAYSKTPTLLLSLDAEKAFDRIHWVFISKTLRKFGFTGNISYAIAALYSAPSTRVLANGVLFKPSTISEGTRQGFPLSSLIFDLVMEPLAEAVRSHPGINGIEIAGFQHKICNHRCGAFTGQRQESLGLVWLSDILQG